MLLLLLLHLLLLLPFLLLSLLFLLLSLLLHLSNQQLDHIPWQRRVWLPDPGEVAGGRRRRARHSPGALFEPWPGSIRRVGCVRRTAGYRSGKSLRRLQVGSTLRLLPQARVRRYRDWGRAPHCGRRMRSGLGSAGVTGL